MIEIRQGHALKLMTTVTDEIGPAPADWRSVMALRQALRAMAAYTSYEWTPEPYEARRARIITLPRKVWHGHPVFRMVCHQCGKERWEQEAILWHLISVDHYICTWCLAKG